MTHDKLNINTGVLFGVPIPEAHEAIGERIQEAVEQAVAESEENGMAKRGKEVTPWLLKRVGELTEGKSLASSTFDYFSTLTCALFWGFVEVM